jgi:hypothetical protein
MSVSVRLGAALSTVADLRVVIVASAITMATSVAWLQAMTTREELRSDLRREERHIQLQPRSET